MCEAVAGWSPTRAEAWLRQAGTAEEYAGLYRAAREFRPASAAALARLGELPEVAETPAVVDAMVALDECFDLLKAAQKAGWKAAPADAATLLWEQFRELARNDDTARRPADYRTHLADAERAAELLRRHLRATPPDPAALDAAFRAAGQSCVACHKAFRNEKK
jgi:cytochrome c556